MIMDRMHAEEHETYRKSFRYITGGFLAIRNKSIFKDGNLKKRKDLLLMKELRVGIV